MTLKSRLKKIEQKINLSDKSQFAKYTFVTYITDNGADEEIKKQEAIEKRIIQIAEEQNISNDRAKQIFDSIDVKFTHIRLVE